MNSTMFGIMLLYFLMPGHLEYLMKSASDNRSSQNVGSPHIFSSNANNQGNLGLHGVYTDIYIKRNALYCSPIYVIATHYCGYPLYGILVFIAILASFVYTCNKWKDVIFVKEHLY